MAKSDAGICTPFNLGAGKGYSVLDMLKAFELASGKAVPCMVQPRRLGDVAENYSDPAKAEELLGWKATNDLNAMCADTWRWQSNNPRGYAE
jgi:UDP-glucose 4-epimerase